MGSLPSHRRGPTAVLWERLRHASTAPHYSKRTYVIPDDFPQRLRRFKEESGLSLSKIARRLGTYRHTVGRWCKAGVRPNQHHMRALLGLADDFGLGYLFTEQGTARRRGAGAAGPKTQKGRIHGCAYGKAAAHAATSSPAHRGVLHEPGRPLVPAPRICAHSEGAAVAGWGFAALAFGLTGSSAISFALGNSRRCVAAAPSSRSPSPTQMQEADTCGRSGGQVAAASAYGHLPSHSKPGLPRPGPQNSLSVSGCCWSAAPSAASACADPCPRRA